MTTTAPPVRRNPRRKLRTLAAATFIAATSLSGVANAVPSVGAVVTDVRLDDAWDKSVPLSRFSGRPLLLVYEDRGSAEQNVALKQDLARLAAGDRYVSRIGLVAVADVSDYDFWPARGFVKDAIKKESRKQKTTIYCDWDGNVRRALGLNRGASNIVLYDRAGRVIFAEAGTLSPERRSALLALLAAQLDD